MRILPRDLGAALTTCSLVVFAFIGCQCGDSLSIATILTLAGSVESDTSTSYEWRPAAVGDDFTFGNGIRTKAASTARLSMANGSAVQIEPETVMRFLASPPGKTTPNLEIEAGKVEIEVGDTPVQLTTSQGTVEIEPGSRSRVRKTKEGYSVRVIIGRAVFLKGGSSTSEGQSIEAGQKLSLSLGAVEIVTSEEGTDSNQPDSEIKDDAREDTDSGIVDSGTVDTSTEVEFSLFSAPALAGYTKSPRLGKADLGVVVGASFTVHSKRAPVIVEFGLGQNCPDGALILNQKTKQAHQFEKGQTRISCNRGLTRYQLYCIGAAGNLESKPVRRGSVVVRRDTGQSSIARATPPVSVFSDGRNYSVEYQDRSPKIIVNWSKAPADDQFYLQFQRSNGPVEKIETPSPRYVFKPGALSDGSYSLKFVGKNTGRASRKTTMELSFDSNAPVGVLHKPASESFQAGDTVEVSGAGAPGWKVSLKNATLDVDRRNRFTGQAMYVGAYRGIAVRFEHRRHGIHYYLRRARN